MTTELSYWELLERDVPADPGPPDQKTTSPTPISPLWSEKMVIGWESINGGEWGGTLLLPQETREWLLLFKAGLPKSLPSGWLGKWGYQITGFPLSLLLSWDSLGKFLELPEKLELIKCPPWLLGELDLVDLGQIQSDLGLAFTLHHENHSVI